MRRHPGDGPAPMRLAAVHKKLARLQDMVRFSRQMRDPGNVTSAHPDPPRLRGAATASAVVHDIDTMRGRRRRTTAPLGYKRKLAADRPRGACSPPTTTSTARPACNPGSARATRAANPCRGPARANTEVHQRDPPQAGAAPIRGASASSLAETELALGGAAGPPMSRLFGVEPPVWGGLSAIPCDRSWERR